MCNEAVTACLALSRHLTEKLKLTAKTPVSSVYLSKFESSPSQIKVVSTVLRAVTWAVHIILKIYAV